MKILYVEDNADYRDTVKRGLELAGETVLLAADARNGLALARKERPDVILLDIWLGEVDGMILAAQLQAAPELAQTVMIAYTGADGDEYKSRALAAGCAAYLPKKVSVTDLITHILPYVKGKKRDQLIELGTDQVCAPQQRGAGQRIAKPGGCTRYPAGRTSHRTNRTHPQRTTGRHRPYESIRGARIE